MPEEQINPSCKRKRNCFKVIQPFSFCFLLKSTNWNMEQVLQKLVKLVVHLPTQWSKKTKFSTQIAWWQGCHGPVAHECAGAKLMWHEKSTSAGASGECHLICRKADSSQQGELKYNTRVFSAESTEKISKHSCRMASFTPLFYVTLFCWIERFPLF